MPGQNISTYQTKIYQFLFGLVVIGLGYVSVRRIAAGQVQSGRGIAAIILGLAAMILLDRRYWLLLPILSGFGLKVPGLPFSGVELGQIAVVGIHFLRLGLHRDTAVKLDSNTWYVFPPFLWMFMIFCMNPAGMRILGTSTIGSRFYMQVALGFCAFFALASQRLTEADCKLLFRVYVFSTAFGLCRGLLIPQADPDSVIFDGTQPERNSRYAFIAFGTLYMFLFSRYSLQQILGSGLRLALAAIFAVLTIYSGKRQMAGRLFIIPWASVFLRRSGRGLAACASVVGAILMLFVIAGDGALWQTPKSAQRALSIVAPKKYLGSAATGGSKDLFREGMRRQARIVIAEHPFVGRKGFSMDLERSAWSLGGFGNDALYAGHAYSGNWHSTWYAFAADFGLPCMVLFALFFLRSVYFSAKQTRVIKPGTYFHAMAMYLAMESLCTLAFSYTSGHSALTFMGICQSYGWAIAVGMSAHRQGFVQRRQVFSGDMVTA